MPKRGENIYKRKDVNCDKMVNSADAVVIVGQFR